MLPHALACCVVLDASFRAASLISKRRTAVTTAQVFLQSYSGVAMPVRVRVSSDEPVDVEIVWNRKSKRVRQAERPGQSAAGSGAVGEGVVRTGQPGGHESAAGSGPASEVSLQAGRQGGRQSATRTGPVILHAGRQGGLQLATRMGPVGGGFVLAGKPFEIGWVGLSTHHLNVKLAQLGSVCVGHGIVTSLMNSTVDLFDERMQNYFGLFMGPVLSPPTATEHGIWLAKVEFSPWVGRGFRPFGTLGRLKSLELVGKANWRTQLETNATLISTTRFRAMHEFAWDNVVVVGWEGNVARCMSMDGTRVHAVYKGFDFEEVSERQDWLMLANLEFMYWDSEAEVRGTDGRLLKITVLGHTQLHVETEPSAGRVVRGASADDE